MSGLRSTVICTCTTAGCSDDELPRQFPCPHTAPWVSGHLGHIQRFVIVNKTFKTTRVGTLCIPTFLISLIFPKHQFFDLLVFLTDLLFLILLICVSGVVLRT